MKLNILFILIASTILISFSTVKNESSSNHFKVFSNFKFRNVISSIQNLKTPDCQYGRCMKIKDDGKQCKNCAQQDSYYCWSHRD